VPLLRQGLLPQAPADEALADALRRQTVQVQILRLPGENFFFAGPDKLKEKRCREELFSERITFLLI
jgi:hypothetical protein